MYPRARYHFVYKRKGNQIYRHTILGTSGYCRVSHGPYFGYFETILDIQKRIVAGDDEVTSSIFQKYIRVP